VLMYQKDYPVSTPTTKYAYAGARLSLLEKDLMTQLAFDQLKFAASTDDLAKMLSDTVYAGMLEGGEDIGYIVEEETIRFKTELYEILPVEDHWFLDSFFKKYDYNNLKICLKTHLIGHEIKLEDLSKCGTIKPEDLLPYFQEDKLAWLPFPIDFYYIKDVYEKEKEMRLIDAYVDRIYYSQLLLAVLKLKDGFFIDYTMQMIDLKNLLIFIRCKTTGLLLEKFVLDGGYIPRETFEKFVEEPNIDVAFTSSDFMIYREVYSKELENWEKTGSYSELETAFRNYLITLIAEAQDTMFSIRPFIAYMLAKEHEINLIKKVYIHIHNKIEFGKERDRLYYA